MIYVSYIVPDYLPRTYLSTYLAYSPPLTISPLSPNPWLGALIGEFKSSYRIARDDVKRRDRLAGTYLRRCIYARRGAR